MTKAAAPVSPRVSHARMAVFVALAASLAFLQSASFGWTKMDDVKVCEDDAPALRSPSFWIDAWTRPHFPSVDSVRVYYRPIVSLSYAMDARRSGPTEVDPAPFHVTNVLLHVIASVLLLGLLILFELPPNAALGASLIFAVNPVHAASIGWIPGRNDTILGIFVFASFIAFIRALDSTEPSAAIRWRLLHGLSFAGAVFTKETFVAFPLVLMTYMGLVRRRSGASLIPAWAAIGWTASAAVYLPLRWMALGGFGQQASSWSSVVHNAPSTFSSVAKAILPAHLSAVATRHDSPAWPGLLLIAAVISIAWRLGSETRLRFLFAVGASLPWVAPSIGQNSDLALENRLYLPAAFMMLAAAYAFELIPPQWRRGLVAVVAIVFFVMAVRYTESFTNDDRFTEAAVNASPSSSLAHLNRGVVLQEKGLIPEAVEKYETSIALDPGRLVVRNNLASVLIARGDFLRAEELLRVEIRLNPNYARAWMNLGYALRGQNRGDEAADAWQKVLTLDPTNIDAIGELMAHYAPSDPARSREYRARLESLGLTFIDSP